MGGVALDREVLVEWLVDADISVDTVLDEDIAVDALVDEVVAVYAELDVDVTAGVSFSAPLLAQHRRDRLGGKSFGRIMLVPLPSAMLVGLQTAGLLVLLPKAAHIPLPPAVRVHCSEVHTK